MQAMSDESDYLSQAGQQPGYLRQPSVQGEALEASDDDEEVTCPWCTFPVAEEGDTCGYYCYALWYAFTLASDEADTLIFDDEGRVTLLVDDGGYIKTMEKQPWYEAEVVG